MLNEHHQTATCVDPAAPLVLGALARLSQEGAAADPRQSDRQPPPAGARRRGNGDDRRALARPPRMRLRARRALRGPAGQQQSGAHERAPVGGARPHRQGLDASRRAVQPRGPLLPPPRHQHLAAPLSAAASADLDQHDHPERRAARRRARLRAGDVPHRLRAARGRSTIAIAAAGARPAAARTCRSTAWPMRPWSMSRRPRPRPAPAPTSCCGTCASNKVPFHLCYPPGYMPVAGADAGAARRRARPACRDEGQDGGRQAPSKPASCSPARPTRSIGRSRSTTTTSAASAIC